jgi:peptidoglycan/xylan/chitin deacetylase (PgdA/CDA1 family)
MFSDVLDLAKKHDDVQITFDDSNESDYSIALPLLRERNMNARFFVVADRIGQKGCLSSQQIRAMQAEGMAIESHGMSHRRWNTLDEVGLREELIEARDRIQQICGMPVTEAACPFGGYNRRAMRRLREEGYRTVFTSDGGRANSSWWVHPRNTITRAHKLSDVGQMIGGTSGGTRELWRDVKMTIKRWR